eukprot:gene3883-4846_t
MSSTKIDIHQIVESLGDYLASRDPLLRARGTLLLSEILCRLPTLPLNEQQIHFLSMFYCDRLQDYPCSSEVVKGITGLISNHQTKYPDNQKLLRSIFQEVHPSTLSQVHRKMVIQIIEIMLSKHLAEVQELKDDFMVGFLQFIDAERDPRNLMANFQLVPKVIRSIPEHKKFMESLFEILSCYYPISFNPQPGDPNAITKDHLSNSLLNCFTSSPLFAEHLIPFLIDKIYSNVVNTKIESLKTLIQCCNIYGPITVKPFLEDIWSTLRSQILTQKNNSVVEESKKVIYQLTKSLALDKDVLKQFLSILVKECMHHIKSSQDSKLAVYCASILYQTVSASSLASQIVLSTCLPSLFISLKELSLQEESAQKLNEQVSLVALINDLLKANIFSYRTAPLLEGSVNPIKQYLPELYKLFTEELMSNPYSAVRQSAAECLSNLYISKTYPGGSSIDGDGDDDSENVFLLNEQQRQDIIKLLVSHLNDTDEELGRKSLDSMFTIAVNENTRVMNIYAIPTLLQMINSSSASSSTNNSATNNNSTQVYLNSFSTLCTHQPLLQSVIPQIKILLSHNIKDQYSSDSEFEKSILVLRSISSILSKSTDEKSMTICCNSILFPMISALFSQVFEMTNNNNNNKKQFESILELCLQMIHSIIQNTSIESQTTAIAKSINIFLNGNIQQELPDLFKTKTPVVFQPLNENDNQQNHRLLIPILTSIVSQSKKDLSTDYKDLFEKLYQASLNLSIPDDIALSCTKAYAAILNTQDHSASSFERFESDLISKIHSSETKFQSKLRLLDLLIWTTKSLLTNGHPANTLLGKALSKLVSYQNRQEDPNNEISHRSVQAFDLLLKETDVLNERSGSRIKILYQQKFFTLLFPELLESFKSARSESSTNQTKQFETSQYLIAITNLLRHIPKEVLLNELSEVVPIVLHSLKSEQSDLLDSSLQTLLMLFNETSSSFVSHLNSLIPILINLSVSGSLLNLRKTSLEILTLISNLIPYQNAFIYRNQIINGILPALDDKKRIVRKEASKCRNSWYILQK